MFIKAYRYNNTKHLYLHNFWLWKHVNYDMYSIDSFMLNTYT